MLYAPLVPRVNGILRGEGSILFSQISSVSTVLAPIASLSSRSEGTDLSLPASHFYLHLVVYQNIPITTTNRLGEEKMFDLVSLLPYLLPILATCRLIPSLLTFTTHLRQARASGLPYIVMPYSKNSVLNTIVFSSMTLPRLIFSCLPTWVAERVKFSALSYRWMVSHRMFEKLGSVFLIVSPADLAGHVADAVIASHIYRSRRKFEKQTNMYREYLRRVIASEHPGNLCDYQVLLLSSPDQKEFDVHIVWPSL